MSSGDCTTYSLTKVDLDYSDKASRNICDKPGILNFSELQDELSKKSIF
jgi:hypothetical protein